MSPFFKRSKPDQNPDDVMIRKDVSGFCHACNHKGLATLTAYFSKEVVIRCKNCNKVGSFEPDTEVFNDPNLFPPTPTTNDEEPGDEGGSGRYSKGKR